MASEKGTRLGLQPADSASLGNLKDVAAPVPIQDKKSASGLVEANIDSTNTGHCGEGQPSPLNRLVA
jgi:hypothetical protein